MQMFVSCEADVPFVNHVKTTSLMRSAKRWPAFLLFQRTFAIKWFLWDVIIYNRISEVCIFVILSVTTGSMGGAFSYISVGAASVFWLCKCHFGKKRCPIA